MKSTKDELEYALQYRLTHKESIKVNRRKYYLKNIDKLRKKHRELWRQLRNTAKHLIGDKCIICGYSGRRLTFHEIHGKSHNKSNIKYYIDNHKDFVSLCYPHHRLLHNLASLSPDNRNTYISLLSILSKDCRLELDGKTRNN